MSRRSYAHAPRSQSVGARHQRLDDHRATRSVLRVHPSLGVPHGRAVGLTLGAAFAENAEITSEDVVDACGHGFVKECMAELGHLIGASSPVEGGRVLSREHLLTQGGCDPDPESSPTACFWAFHARAWSLGRFERPNLRRRSRWAQDRIRLVADLSCRETRCLPMNQGRE